MTYTSKITRRALLKGFGFLSFGHMLPGWLAFSELPPMDPRKRIYIAADDHTDYFWSGDDDDYREAFLEMLDYYLDYADRTLDLPPEQQMRWNCDGSFWLWTYEKYKPPADFERLIEHIRSGHIQAPLNALVLCLGGAPAEAVLRGMNYAGQLERRYNLRFPIAIAMENQTLSYGLSALWAGSGARYSWKGICHCDSHFDPRDREHEIYWMAGPDGSRILMKWNSMLSEFGNSGMGGYAEARFPEEIIEYVDSDPDFIDRYPYRVMGVFGNGWDDLKTFTDEFVPAAQNMTNSRRKVIVSNQIDFFEDFEAKYGSDLPTVACTFGNEWDMYCSALAEVSASVKRSVEKLRSAESLAALVALEHPTLLNPDLEARDRAWMNLGLFWEHNFGVVDAFQFYGEARVAWQRRLADELQTYVARLYAEAKAALARLIPNSGALPRFYVFNPLSWARTDFADLDLTPERPVHIIDIETGQEVPSQWVTADSRRFLRILATDVPSVGYRVFELREGNGGAFPDAASILNRVIENDFYRITVAVNGAITSLIDKVRGNREFAQRIEGRTVNDLGPGRGALSIEAVGAVSATVVISATGPLAHTTRITLYPFDRIDIHNTITENFDETHTWAFSFNLTNPDVWHEEVGAIIRARLLEEGGQYASRNARYDWLTLNHFADMSGDEGVGVTLSNADCYFMNLGSSTVEILDTVTPRISPLVGGRVVRIGGIPAQGGDDHFVQRFALRTHDAFDPIHAMRFALEHQNPLTCTMIMGDEPRLPDTTYSVLESSGVGILLWALKPADDSQEQVIARFWNVATQPSEAIIHFADNQIVEAVETTHVETPIGQTNVLEAPGMLPLSLPSQGIKTYLLKKTPLG